MKRVLNRSLLALCVVWGCSRSEAVYRRLTPSWDDTAAQQSIIESLPTEDARDYRAYLAFMRHNEGRLQEVAAWSPLSSTEPTVLQKFQRLTVAQAITLSRHENLPRWVERYRDAATP